MSNLLRILAAFTGRSIPELEAEFAGKMYGHLKVAVADAVNDTLAPPIRERALALLAEGTELDRILAEGAEKAEAVAQATVREVYDRVGLLAR